MMEAASHVSERAAELRRDFDRSFAEPPRVDTVVKDDLLAIRLGAQGFAMRLSEITGLFADKKVTRVPGASAALLGIAGFRGSIVPVYDLQSLLGHSGGQTPRWLVIAAAAPVAFAFEAFEGQLRVSPEVDHASAVQRGDTPLHAGLRPDRECPTTHHPFVFGPRCDQGLRVAL